MDDARFDQVIRGAFRYGVEGHQPPDRWGQIAEAIRQERRRSRRAAVVGAAAAVLLVSLLLPPVRAVAAKGVMALWKILWEGRAGGRPAQVVTLPEPGTGAVPSQRDAADPEAPGAAHQAEPPQPGELGQERQTVSDLAEAAALAGFDVPAVRQEGAVMREAAVITVPAGSQGEMRVVEAVYSWQGQLYTLSARAVFLRGDGGSLDPEPVPVPALTIYTPAGEAVQGTEVVDLGGVEAVCTRRTVGGGYTLVQCDWLAGDVRVSLNGPDFASVVQLAETAVHP